MKRFSLSPLAVSAFAVLIAAVLPAFATPYVVKLLIMAGIYIGLACSLNIIFGLAGQLSLGQAGFYGIGAYAAALLTVHFHIPYLLALLSGTLLAAGVGYLLALPTIRLKGIYLSVTTLAFGEITRLILLNWISVTRGPMGVTGIPLPSLFGFRFSGNTSQYYLLLGLLIPALYVFWRISYSPFGMILRALRENEEAARTLGINTKAYKIKAFIISGGAAGLFGAFFAFHAAYISPDNFAFMESITILSMVVFGGMGSMPGVIVGALFLSLAPDAMRFLANYRMIIYGLLLFLMVLLRPQGLISEQASLVWAAWAKRNSRKKSINVLDGASREGGG